MKLKYLALSVSLLLFISFFFFSRSVRSGVWKDFDLAATVKIQERIDKSTHLRTAAIIGDVLEGSVYSADPAVSVFLVGLLTLIYFIDIKRKKIRLSALTIPILFTLLILTEIYGKTVVHHPAPPFMFIKNPVSHFPAYHVQEQFSYPSGHTARAVFITVIFFILLKPFSHLTIKPFTLIKKGTIIILGLLYFSAVSISVVYLGHHWASDVMGGLLIGLAFSLTSLMFWK